MTFDFTGLWIEAEGEAPAFAAKLFAEEIGLRAGKMPAVGRAEGAPCIALRLCGTDTVPDKDSYSLALDGNLLTVSALGIRGLIFGYSYFLRKTVYEGDKITLIKDISGVYSPYMKIRGHQLGYRSCPNTYDAWTPEDYFRYYRDMMFFGCNTVEHMPPEGDGRRNRLMKYEAEEMLIEGSRLADELDLDVSIWYPNDERESDEQAVSERRELLEKVPRVNVIFPPGGDPGEMEAGDFITRCRKISRMLSEVKPGAEMWPSAQAPHSMPDWGEEFLNALETLPDEITGVITGPNRAFPMDELRRRLPGKYPIRFYPDITHNVRCEHPVHFTRDDWHYALTTCLSRESINPRPSEYRLLHRMTRPYIVGSVSYSEGINDDVNKFVWSDMDYFPDVSLNDTLGDYARLFFPGIPVQKVVDGIMGFEYNWVGDPAENPNIENTLALWEELGTDYPSLGGNWRYNICLFRARCDALVRRRRLFGLSLCEQAVFYLDKYRLDEAENVLNTHEPAQCADLRASIEPLAKTLFEQIGLQLDIERYGASGWERGATLETIDLPVTDVRWLLNRIAYARTLPEDERQGFVTRLLTRNSTAHGKYYWSFAEHGFELLRVPQEGETYVDFRGDRPNVNNSEGNIPTSMFKVFDNYTFKMRVAGLESGRDYTLRIAFIHEEYRILNQFNVKADGMEIYRGRQFDGVRDPDFDRELLAPGFVSVSYNVPAEAIHNGCTEITINEPKAGIKLAEVWLY